MSRLPDPSKWPAGATHYHPAVDGFVAHWVKVHGDETYFCVTDFEHEGWKKDVKSRAPSKHWIELKPVVEGWTGEGIPPADTVCEVTTPAMDGTRIKVTIKYVGEERIIANDGLSERCWLISHCTFYPIRTPEQIAAEERADDLKAMLDVIIAATGHSVPMAEVVALYDAGYRKQAAPIRQEEDTSDIDYSIKAGDTVQTDHWVHSSLEVIDVNWALRAIAVRLGPTGGIVVWPARGMMKVAP